MKALKRIISVILCVFLAAALFAGCSQTEAPAKEITDKTMLIAYTAECSPFIFKDKNGELTGFDVELIEGIFESVKGEYSDFAFIQVSENYRLNEDACYTDKSGKDYYAKIMVGGRQKNVGTANKDVCWSNNIIENNIIMIVPIGSPLIDIEISSGLKAGTASEAASDALDKNTAFKNNFSSVTDYETAEDAFSALENGEIDALAVEDFDFYTFDGRDRFAVLNGVLGTVEYAYQFAKSDNRSYSFNEAIMEMQSPDYGDGDTLTPIVEKYFGYKEACVFEYNAN